MEGIQNLLSNVMVNMVLGLLTLATAYGTLFIKRTVERLRFETQWLEKEEQVQIFNRALDRLEEVAKLTVNEIEQTTAKAIRGAVSNGSIDRDELQNLSIVAYSEIREVLEPEYLSLLENTLGDAEKYILSVIEDKLVEIKKRDNKLNLGEVG